MHILDINATSVGAVMKPAGLEASKGVISVNYGKDPLDPTWKDDAGMKKYFDFMAKYYPEGDKDSSFNTYGYITTQLLIHVLKQCGDDLTRENVMKQATSLKNVQLDLSLPGIVGNTSPTDYRVNKQLQMMKFNGERWELFGPILEDAGAGRLVPCRSPASESAGALISRRQNCFGRAQTGSLPVGLRLSEIPCYQALVRPLTAPALTIA